MKDSLKRNGQYSQEEATRLSRKNFLKAAGLGSAALALGFYFPAGAHIVNILAGETAADNEAPLISLNAWIHIDTNGQVTLFDHRAEMGQGSYHSVPQIIAEELEVDLKDIQVSFAPGNRNEYGGQITGGSSTIRGSYKKLLKLSATARMMLVQAAANQWKVDVSTC